jgi:hypothetical protein
VSFFAIALAALQLSSNWSGYVASAPTGAAPLTFTHATGSWRVPKVVCTRSGTSAAFWVGIGGSTPQSPALEQLGTSADCEPNGLPLYRAWTEIVPDPADFISLKVRPGDLITSALVVQGQTVTMSIANQTTRKRGHMGVLTDPAWLVAPIALVPSSGAAHYTAKSNSAGAVPNQISSTGRGFTVSYRSTTFARNVPPAPLPGAPLPNFVH